MSKKSNSSHPSHSAMNVEEAFMLLQVGCTGFTFYNEMGAFYKVTTDHMNRPLVTLLTQNEE